MFPAQFTLYFLITAAIVSLCGCGPAWEFGMPSICEPGSASQKLRADEEIRSIPRSEYGSRSSRWAAGRLYESTAGSGSDEDDTAGMGTIGPATCRLVFACCSCGRVVLSIGRRPDITGNGYLSAECKFVRRPAQPIYCTGQFVIGSRAVELPVDGSVGPATFNDKCTVRSDNRYSRRLRAICGAGCLWHEDYGPLIPRHQLRYD